MRNLYYLLKMARLSMPYKARKYITILLFIILGFFLFQSMAYAVYDPNVKHSKWFLDKIVADPTVKSSVEVKAQRTYPVSTLGPDGRPIIQNKVQKTTIRLGATSGSVAKTLAKRVPAIAITQALVGLSIGAVDWVMDAENNRVKYNAPVSGSSEPPSPSNPKYYTFSGSLSVGRMTGTSVDSLAVDACLAMGLGDLSRTSVASSTATRFYCSDKPSTSYLINYVDNPSYDSSAPVAPTTEEKYVSLDTLARKMIEQANSATAGTGTGTGTGDGSAALEVMSNAAIDQLEAGLLDAQLEAAADPKVFEAGETDATDPNQTPNPDAPVDPNAPPKEEAAPFELPPFCMWATKVCDFIDWVQTEPPEPEDSGDIRVEEPDANMHVPILERLYISMPAQCPADPVLEFMGARIPFPMSIFCQFATMMKPLILLFAYIKGLSVIGNGLN